MSRPSHNKQCHRTAAGYAFRVLCSGCYASVRRHAPSMTRALLWSVIASALWGCASPDSRPTSPAPEVIVTGKRIEPRDLSNSQVVAEGDPASVHSMLMEAAGLRVYGPDETCAEMIADAKGRGATLLAVEEHAFRVQAPKLKMEVNFDVPAGGCL